MYMFALLKESIGIEELISEEGFESLFDDALVSIKLHNSKDWVHKLSHQHLYTKFWVVQAKSSHADLISIGRIKEYAIPRLVDRFIESFDFEAELVAE